MLHPDTALLLEKPTQELELETCSVLIYTHLSFMQILWKESGCRKEYQANTLQVLQILAKLKLKFLLTDAHQLKHLDNNNWLLEICGSILAKSGVQKVARIIPFNASAVTQGKKLIEVKDTQPKYKCLTFAFEVFTDLDDAFHWLAIPQPGFNHYI